MKDRVRKAVLYFRQRNMMVILGVELVVILLALAYALYPKPTYDFAPEELFWKADEPCDTDSQGWRGFSETGHDIEGHNIMTTPWMILWPGHYRTTISYSSELLPNGEQGKYPAVIVSCNDQDAVRCYEGHLNPSWKSQTILLIAQKRCDNVWLMFRNDGNSLMLGNIRVAFDTGFALWAVLALALGLLAADISMLLLFPKSPLALSSNARAAAVLLIVIVLVGCAPALLLGRSIIGHDAVFHSQRIQMIAEELKRGQFPVRLYTQAKSDFGYAPSLFYGEIFLYLPALLYMMGAGIQLASTAYVLLATIAIVLVSYFCFLGIFKRRRFAMMGTVLYSLAYCRLCNVYVRAAVGEYTAMIFMPLVLYAMWLLYRSHAEPQKAFLPLVIAMSGILQSHLISLELTVIAVGGVALIFWKKTFSKEVLTVYLKAAGTTVLLNLWFLLPFLQAMKCGVSATGKDAKLSDYLLLSQMLMGTSYTGIGLVLAAGAVGFVFVCIWQANVRGKYYRLGRVCVVAGGIMALGCTRCFPWGIIQNIPVLGRVLSQVQFPWRWAGMASLLLSTATVCAVAMLEQVKSFRAERVFAVMCIALNLLAVGDQFQSTIDWNIPNDIIEPAQDMTHNGNMAYDLDKLYEPMGTIQDSHGIIIEEPVNAEVLEQTREDGVVSTTCRSDATEEGAIELPLLYYPGYRIIEGKGQLYQATDGTVGLRLPAGYEGTVRVEYRGLPIWRIAEMISTISVMMLIMLPIYRKKRKLTKKKYG